MKQEVSRFVENYFKEIQSQNAAVFLGAGASVPAGFVNWKNLLAPIADELNLDIDLESDLVALAQFHVNSNGDNRNVISQSILDALGEDLEPTRNHRLLAKLPISAFWTTNYDKLIELSLKDEGKIPDVKYTVEQLANTRSKRDATVYKMHGDIDLPQKTIITKDEYEKYHKTHGAFVNALSGDLVSKTFVFIGFSFTDPNLDYILSRIRVTFETHQRRHYAFFKKRTKLKGETEAEFENAVKRQKFLLDDLKRFNITSILVDDYSEITEAFEALTTRFRMGTAFVSSSAADFEPWGEDQVTNFVRTLGAMLIDNSYRVATGLGLGVGNALFTGALEQVYRSKDKQVDDCLLIRPFPQFVPNRIERENLWREYRKDFIPSAGLALFLFGNKEEGGKIVDANGVVSEFEIAAENGVVVLPIGATGSASKVLADRIIENPNEYPSVPSNVIPLLKDLNKPVENLNELLQPILDLLKKVN